MDPFPLHTARPRYDDCTTFILIGPYGDVYGSFADEEKALFEREALAAEGFECWVQAVDHPAFD